MASVLKVNEIQHTGGTSALTIGSTGIISQPNLPVFNVSLSADQTLNDVTTTVLQFNNESNNSFDPEGIWDSSNYKITVDANTLGYYWISVAVYTNSTNTVESGNIYYRKNGAQIHQFIAGARSSGGSTSQSVIHAGAVVDLTTSGDEFDIVGNWDVSSGGTTTVNELTLSQTRCFASGFRLR